MNIKFCSFIVSVGLVGGVALHAVDPVFLLKNSGQGPIQITLQQGGGIMGPRITLEKGKSYSQVLNTSLTTNMDVYYCSEKTCDEDELKKLTAYFPANTKIYVRFENENIKPQTGTKTSEGYSLENNVKSPIKVYRSSAAPRQAGDAAAAKKSKKVSASDVIGLASQTVSAVSAGIQAFSPQQQSQSASSSASEEMPEEGMDEKAWQQFPAANELRKADADPITVAFKVLAIDIDTLPEAYDEKKYLINTKYGNLLSKLAIIKDAQLRDAAKAIARDSLRDALAFIE